MNSIRNRVTTSQKQDDWDETSRVSLLSIRDIRCWVFRISLHGSAPTLHMFVSILTAKSINIKMVTNILHVLNCRSKERKCALWRFVILELLHNKLIQTDPDQILSDVRNNIRAHPPFLVFGQHFATISDLSPLSTFAVHGHSYPHTLKTAGRSFSMTIYFWIRMFSHTPASALVLQSIILPTVSGES